MTSEDDFHQLSFYTISLSDADFIHQHIVDAYTAQTATEQTKPIALFFALAGLYLFLHKSYSGKDVQIAHSVMAKQKHHFPNLALPKFRGSVTAKTVLSVQSDIERKTKIRGWCEAVWQSYYAEHDAIITQVNQLLGI